MKIKSFLFSLFMLVAGIANAQNWGGGIDDTDLHFGFTFQYISSEYKLLKKTDWKESPGGIADLPDYVPRGLSAIAAKPTPGFGIGFVVNQKVLENVDLRLTPILVFNDRVLNYRFENIPVSPGQEFLEVEKKVQSTLVEFPLGLKIKSNRRNNFRAYMIGGLKYSMDISSRKKSDNTKVDNPMEMFLNNKRNYLSYEAGLGMDLYFEYFKMSPELKLSYSFDSVMKREMPHVFSNPIDKLMLRHVTFSLFFE
ncbi:outer membrane beta-barrel protein [Pedobacter gandavensis]|uniref:type IX secretion/gliding motility protein PorT/SprT n=1 Tax=Pedobacter gandavensis TaxID=2679963 RepID=UPI00292E85D9|nr:outer membrane beta-barrel protein [Pedobacter gandavensis]